MNFNKLKYFYEISKFQNLSLASKEMFVSQSSLSKTIADLETDFGTKLFYRDTRKLTLTPAGKELLKEIKDFFDSEYSIYQKVRSISQYKTEEIIGEIKIGYIANQFGLNIIPFIKNFQEHYPKINIISKRLSNLVIENSLKDNSIDLVCFTFDENRDNSEVNYEILSKSYLSVILNKNHPLANKKTISFNDIKNEKFIMLGHDNSSVEYNNIINWCKKYGFYLNIIDAFDHVETVLLHLQNTNYLTFLSENSAYYYFKNLISIPMKKKFMLYDGFMWNKINNNIHISLFIKEYKKWLKK